MSAIRSVIHMLWMLITVIPTAFYMMAAAPFATARHMLASDSTHRSHRRANHPGRCSMRNPAGGEPMNH